MFSMLFLFLTMCIQYKLNIGYSYFSFKQMCICWYKSQMIILFSTLNFSPLVVIFKDNLTMEIIITISITILISFLWEVHRPYRLNNHAKCFIIFYNITTKTNKTGFYHTITPFFIIYSLCSSMRIIKDCNF